MFAGRTLARCVAGLAVVAVLGCDSGDTGLPAADLLSGFEAGASRDEVIEALPDGAVEPGERVGEGQLANGYVLERYLIDAGRVEVVWVHDPAVGLPETNGELRSSLNPVVFQDGALDGAGWSHYERRMEDWGLPEIWSVPPVRAEPSEESGETGGSEVSPPGQTEAERGETDGPTPSPPDPNERPVSVPNNTSDRV